MKTPLSGIYQIVNTINGKKYIGSSVNIEGRWAVHKSGLKAGKHVNAHLQNAWNKYGESIFDFRVLFYCDPEMLILYEQMCLDKFHPEYNIAKCAAAPMLGRHFSVEAKQKMSEARKGHVVSPKTRERMSKALKGRIPWITGKHHSKETRRKISEAHEGAKNHNYGKRLSMETRKKLSEANKGEKNPNYGKHPSVETRKKLSEAVKGAKNHNYGKHHSEETKRKISEGNKRYWESKKVMTRILEEAV